MMQQEGRLAVAEGGWLASANYVGYLLGALSAMVIRLSPVTAIRAALVTISLATLAMGLAHGFAAWVVLRTVAGIASAWVLIFVSSWSLARLGPLRRPLLNGTVFAGVGTGIAAAGAICLVLMNAGAGSTQAWYSLGVFALGVTALAWPVFAAGPDASTPDGRRVGDGGRRWEWEWLRLVLCYGCFGFGYIIPATFVPVMARQAIRDPAVFGWSWPIFGAAAAISTLAAVVGLRIVGNRRVWVLSHLVMALGVSLPVFWPRIAGIMLAALLVGGTFMVITMAGMQEARSVAGARATTLMAALTAAFALGQIAGPLLVSVWLGPTTDFSRPLLVACALLVASAWALTWRRRDVAA
jgi:uncharacterized MFS-type transporter YbfB